MRLLLDQNLPLALAPILTRDIRAMQVQDLGRLIAANLAGTAGVVEERGNAVFTVTPSKPIRASLLPLGIPGKE